MDSLKIFISKRRRRVVLFLSALSAWLTSLLRRGRKENGWQSQTDLDKKLVYSLSKSRIPSLKQLKYIKKFLSPQEAVVLKISFAAIIVSVFFSGAIFYKDHLQVAPIKGGEYAEGLIGSPKYINPLYSRLSDVDKDLAVLIFSSLFKRNESGELVGDLALKHEIGSDNKTYTVFIRNEVNWHNGGRLTVDDVIFTFNAIKDAKYKSPLKSFFGGVEIEKIDDQTAKFILAEPYAAFLELLTFGIMPAELWGQIPPDSANLAELNLKPVGSGPYKFSKLTKDSITGAVVDYSLAPNDDYYQKPALINLKFKFYPNFEEAAAALKSSAVDGLSYLPKDMEKDLSAAGSLNFHKLHIPQLTLVYFNPKNNPALAAKEARLALGMAVNRAEITEKILDRESYLVDSPILPDSFAYYDSVRKSENNPEAAADILDNLGWKIAEIKTADLEEYAKKAESGDEKEAAVAKIMLAIGPGRWRVKDGKYFTVKLTTVDRAENRLVVESVKEYWERIGIKTELEILPSSDMQKNVIKPRNFETLFYGLAVGADPDPYVFWHSSQANENGFNIANFSDKEADQLLEDARLITDIEARKGKYKRFQEIISEQAPVFFMYSPTYTYIQGKKVKNFKVENIIIPSDRFANATEWYINTGKKIIW